ncbi:hypothetical protein GCM10023196_098850 [Actinoallomurus vinaceus]|uniref:Uncharacterized protein n=1 Tax=Actinoallomurus vinaceus TaxID=1080074 RepID=A0ABP8UWD7_9ACTN
MTVAPDLGVGRPGPDTPVFPRQHLTAGYRGPVIRFSDDRWPLSAINDNPSADVSPISWSGFPSGLREELRLAAWIMINSELPGSFLRGRATTWRSRVGARCLYRTVMAWRDLAVWLERRGIDTLADCATETLEEYGAFLRDRGPPATACT